MRTGELSSALGVSQDTLRRLALGGIIPGRRLPVRGAHWRFASSSLDTIRQVLTDAGLIEERTPRAGSEDRDADR
jgi:hypothetical protein